MHCYEMLYQMQYVNFSTLQCIGKLYLYYCVFYCLAAFDTVGNLLANADSPIREEEAKVYVQHTTRGKGICHSTHTLSEV